MDATWHWGHVAGPRGPDASFILALHQRSDGHDLTVMVRDGPFDQSR